MPVLRWRGNFCSGPQRRIDQPQPLSGRSTQAHYHNRQPQPSDRRFLFIGPARGSGRINALIFEWENNAQNQFLLVQLDASQDLLNWHSLGQGSLVQVQEQGQSLITTALTSPWPNRRLPTCALTILRGAEHLRITQISAEEQHLTHTPPAAALERWSLAGTVAKEQTSAYAPRAHSPGNPVRAFEFSRQESAPAEQLSIHLGTQPYANSLRLFARATPQDAWQ